MVKILGFPPAVLLWQAENFCTEVLASTTTIDSFSYEKDLQVSLGDSLETLTRPDQIVENDDGRLKVSLANASYDKVETKTHQTDMTGSNITSSGDVTLGAEGSVRIEGSNLASDLDESGDGDVNLFAKKDVTIKEATELFEQETKEMHGEAEVSFVVQHQAAEVAKAVLAAKEAEDKLKQAKKDYKQYEKDLDNLKNTLTALETDYENQTPGVNYEDVLELRELVDDVQGDKDWYVAGVTLAAANLAAKVTAVAQQTAAAAASTGTYGFNAGIQLDIDATNSKESIRQTTSVASNVSGQNINIITGAGQESAEGTATLIQGSHLQAADKLSINTGELNVLASRDELETDSETNQMIRKSK